MSDEELLERFVASLECDQMFTHGDPPPDELAVGINPADWNQVLWKPARIDTPASMLKSLYDDTLLTFPPLFVQLILSWRWLEVSSAHVRLFSNPPGPNLEPLWKQIHADPVFQQHLLANGYVMFGLHIDRYDPICFDTTRRQSDGDCPVVQFEHEEILSFDRRGKAQVLWQSCRAMMHDSVEKHYKSGDTGNA